MKISERLKRISSYIDDNSNIIDVGCDHALLDIYLVNNKKSINCIASDINEGPLKQALNNINKYNLNDKIITKLGDGLEYLNETVDTIIISGLGGSTIIDIILRDKDKLNNIKNIVLSPNNDFYKVRKEITKLGYIIKEEELFNDKDKTYLIIKFIKGRKKYNKKQLMFGINLSKNIYYKKIMLKEKLNLIRIPRKYIFKRIKTKINIRNYKKMF